MSYVVIVLHAPLSDTWDAYLSFSSTHKQLMSVI